MATTAKLTLGSILGAVSSTANTAVNVLDTVNSGVEYLNNSMSAALQKQKDSIKADIEIHKETIALDSAKTLVEGQIKVTKWVKDNGAEQQFAEAYAKMQALFSDSK